MKVFQMQWRFLVLCEFLVKEHTATFFEGKLFFTHLRKIMRCVSIRGIHWRSFGPYRVIFTAFRDILEYVLSKHYQKAN